MKKKVRRIEERVAQLEAEVAALRGLVVMAGAMMAGAHEDAPGRDRAAR